MANRPITLSDAAERLISYFAREIELEVPWMPSEKAVALACAAVETGNPHGAILALADELEDAVSGVGPRIRICAAVKAEVGG